MVADKILRVSNSSPSKVRPDGVTRSRTLYQSWISLFPRSSAPRPGLRHFDQSGVSILHKARDYSAVYRAKAAVERAKAANTINQSSC